MAPVPAPSGQLAAADRFAAVQAELNAIRDKVVVMRDWFARHSTRPRLYFRAVGTATILLSILVPFLTNLEGYWKTIVLPCATLAIAAFTSLSAFYQWQTSWQGNRQTQYALEHLLAKWDLDLTAAKAQGDTDKAIALAITATAKLLDQAREVTTATTEDFFKSIQVPATK
jgi:Protein of unknown function (DUF4231)